MAIGHRRGSQVVHAFRQDRRGTAGQFHRRAVEQAGPFQEVLLAARAQFLVDVYRADVRALGNDGRHIHPRADGVQIRDRVTAHLDRIVDIEHVGRADRAGLQRGRHGQRLEDGAQFIQRTRRPVHAGRIVDGDVGRPVRIEGRPAGHGANLAGARLQQDDGSAFEPVCGGRGGQFGFDSCLHTIVDGQAQRLPARSEALILAELDAAGADAVDIHEAQHLSGQRAARIGPADLFLEPQAFKAQVEHGLATARGSRPCRPAPQTTR